MNGWEKLGNSKLFKTKSNFGIESNDGQIFKVTSNFGMIIWGVEPNSPLLNFVNDPKF